MPDLLSLFPPGSAVDHSGMLRLGGCRADDLAAQYGTPVLVVVEQAVRDLARAYRDGLGERWPRSRVVFASKAFPSTGVQRLMVEEGLGLDVAGGGEIFSALAAGVDPALVVLHGNAKSAEEIRLVGEHRLGLVVVDGPDDVDRLEAVLPADHVQDVLVRVTPGVVADTHAHVLTGHEGSKFGLAPGAARALIERIERSPGLRMRGLHVHVGSQILDVEPFVDSVAALATLGRFPVYDLGGGLGARYTWADRPPPLDDYLDALVGAAREHLPADAELILEPGRSLVATAAATVYRVETVKRGSRTFVAVDGGMGDNLEVALFQQRFEAGIVDRLDVAGLDSAGLDSAGAHSSDVETVTVVGRHCESGDVLVDRVPLVAPRVGDLLAVPATGAYCHTMANNYNGSRRIPVVLVRDGSSRLVVRRETWADLLARDVRQHTWPDGVELVKLDLETMAALVDGDLGRARSITGSPLTAYLVDQAWLWRIRHAQVLEDPAAADWVARAALVDGEVVGHVGFHGPPDERGMVEVAYSVDPALRRRGHARRLLTTALAWAAAEPAVRTVRASIAPDNIASLATIAPFGFVFVGEQWDDEDGRELVFERSLR